MPELQKIYTLGTRKPGCVYSIVRNVYYMYIHTRDPHTPMQKGKAQALDNTHLKPSFRGITGLH